MSQPLAKGKQKFKRQDFVFENAWFQSIIKKPGSLSMQQFQISDCQQCSIFIFDSNAGVYVDDCKYCTVFIGPSQSSVFIRDCHHMNIICLTKQFRTRQCTNCNIWLWCETQAIVESSHHLTFSCFPSKLGYGLLKNQMKQANLKLWNNNWFNIYDFTPIKYSIVNYQCIQSIHGQEDHFSKVQAKMKQICLKPDNSLVPYSIGTQWIQKHGQDSYQVVVIYPVPETAIGFSSLHSRLSNFPPQLNPYVSIQKVGSPCLFIKIKSSQWQNWVSISQPELYIVAIIKDSKAKQILQSKVFVPFVDER